MAADDTRSPFGPVLREKQDTRVRRGMLISVITWMCDMEEVCHTGVCAEKCREGVQERRRGSLLWEGQPTVDSP